MNIKKIDRGITRVLKTDEEVLVEAMSASDRILVLKAKAKASCVVATPEMVDHLKELARNGKTEKTRLEAIKTIVAYGLGMPDKEVAMPLGNPNQKMKNEEIDAILEEDDLERTGD